MGVRTFDKLDVINWVVNQSPSTAPVTFNNLGPADFSILSSQSYNQSPGASSAWGDSQEFGGFFQFNVVGSGDWDFAASPVIPSNARITRVTIRLFGSLTVNITGSLTSNGPSSTGTASAAFGGFVKFPGQPDDPYCIDSAMVIDKPAGSISDPKTGAGDLLTSVIESILNNENNETIFDFTLAPIDLATFQSQFGSFVLRTVDDGASPWSSMNGFQGVGGTQSSPDDSSDVNVDNDCTVTISNLQMLVEYTEGPFVVVPAGGDVEPGQYITVIGPGAGSLEYAALEGDKVIPIIPKIIGPNEVEIPVPYPPSDDCTGCLSGDCTQCDTCFDLCENDLTGAPCQECIDACLACLVECLENLELGEDCQQSSQDPPEIPIVIICGGPKFNGSVPLGNFTILIARASGIYRFIPGKTNDTLYATARDGTTYDVAIPKPFAKTGFFRS